MASPRLPRLSQYSGSQILAVVLTVVLIGYISWKISESADQALQFAFNGASVGAIYALLAIGFTLVYSTVWFFDLYYGAAAAIGAYGVFYLRSKDALKVGQFEVNDLYVKRRIRPRGGRRGRMGFPGRPQAAHRCPHRSEGWTYSPGP